MSSKASNAASGPLMTMGLLSLACVFFWGAIVFAPVGPSPTAEKSMESVPISKAVPVAIEDNISYSYSELKMMDLDQTAIPTTIKTQVIDERKDPLGDILRPVAVEVGTILLLHTFGLTLLARMGGLVRRLEWARVARPLLSRAAAAGGIFRPVGNRFGKAWKFMKLYYKKTAASKIVGRGKKYVKVAMHAHHDEEHDHEHHDEAHHDEKAGAKVHAH